MKFIKFPSLINSYQEKAVTNAQLNGIPEWTVTEKVHGANMGIYCDGEIVRPASRNNLVDGSFFNCGPVVASYEEDIKSLYRKLRLTDEQYLIVYGEYFGGTFKGESLDQAKKVQKGIDYIPGNDFLAFNVAIVTNDVVSKWVDTKSLQYFLKDCELRTVPILTTGSLSHCLNFNNQYNSEIPASYDLTTEEDNFCEGNVIFPSSGEDYVVNDIFMGFKNKNSAWSEKSSQPKEAFNINDALQAKSQELSQYATENRFQNVLSKEGEFNSKLIGKYIGLMLKDIYEDYAADGNLLPEPKLERKYLQVQLTTVVRNIILKHI